MKPPGPGPGLLLQAAACVLALHAFGASLGASSVEGWLDILGLYRDNGEENGNYTTLKYIILNYRKSIQRA